MQAFAVAREPRSSRAQERRSLSRSTLDARTHSDPNPLLYYESLGLCLCRDSRALLSVARCDVCPHCPHCPACPPYFPKVLRPYENENENEYGTHSTRIVQSRAGSGHRLQASTCQSLLCPLSSLLSTTASSPLLSSPFLSVSSPYLLSSLLPQPIT